MKVSPEDFLYEDAKDLAGMALYSRFGVPPATKWVEGMAEQSIMSFGGLM